MAGFGLSAFFFTTLSNILFKSTTSMFLLILALGTSCLMLLGFLFVRPVPSHPEQASSQSLENVREPDLIPAPQYHNHSRTPLLNDGSIKDRYIRNEITTDGECSNSVGGVVEATHSVQVSDQKHSTPLNVHGIALLRNFDFWLLFSIYSMRMFPFSGFF